MRSQRMFFVAVVLTVLCACSQIATAQSVYGNIKGTLTDISGKPIAGGRVAISSVGKGTKYRTVTDGSGFYAVNNVSPDDYSLRIEADGFKTFQNPLVTVYADNTSLVNPRLVTGSAAEVVTGSAADVSVLKIDRTDVATILSQRQVSDLPLLNQNVSNLGVLAPGAIPVKATLPPVQNPQQGVYINLNGQIFSGTAYQLDGTDNRDPIEGLVIINPNQDAISEMKITAQNYSSEFGEATAGVVTAQTRSGSNALHGSLFGYRQSGWGQASDPYLSAAINNRTYKKNQFGGSIGGAIIKNRLFYFADYRGTRDTSGATLTLTIPTLAVRNTCLGPSAAAGVNCDLSEYGVTLSDPTTNNRTDNLNGSLGPAVVGASNNMLNNAQVSSQMAYLLNLLPTPTITSGINGGPPPISNNYLATGAEPFNSDNSDLRLDYDAAQKLKLFTRYSFDLFRQDGSPAFGVAGGPGTNPDLFAGHARTANQSGASGFSYSFGNSLLTDFRFGYLRYHLDMNAPDFGTYPLVNASPSNTIYLNNPSSPADIFSSGLPDFQIPGVAHFGYSSDLNSCNCPLREHEQQYQFVNNWTKLAGHHSFRWGADFRYIKNLRLSSSSGNSASRAGQFQFGGEYSGFSLADFLLGLPDFFDRTYSDPTTPAAFKATENQKRAFFYGEDTWRVSSRLTINYGLRWELYFPQLVNADAGGFVLIHNDTLPSLSNATVNVAGSSGVNRQGNVKNTYKNFGPRIGFAYLFGPKTVIRAGYGRSFDVGYQGALFGIAATQNPPVAASFDIRNGATTKGFALNTNDGSANPPAVNLSSFTQFQMGSFHTLQDLCQLQPVNNSSQYSCLLADLTSMTNPTGSPASGAGLYALPARIRVPTVDSWNLTLQHELTPNMYFELAYVGDKGTHVLTDSTPYYDLNATSLNFVQPYTGNTPPGACKQIDSSAYCAQAPAAHVPLAPWDFPVFYFGNNASDNYNSLQAKFGRRFSGGFSVLANYVYSKVLDYDSSYFAVNPGVGYGPASFDRRQSFAMANSWALPIGRGRALLKNISNPVDKVLGGWSLNAITSWYGGLPFSPTYRASSCNADLGSDASSTPPCRPNIVGPVSVTGNRNQFFTTTNGTALAANGSPCGLDPSSGQPVAGPASGSWQRPGCGQIGNAGRNSIRGPQFFQSDVALMKEIPIAERVNLRFRADAFNVFNKVNLGLPNPRVDAPQGAGAITSIAPGAIQRQWEFSARLQF